MAFRKYLSVTNISSILGIFSFIILAITLPKDDLYSLTKIIILPFSENLNPGLEGTRFAHWLVITLAMIVYIIFILGIMKLLNKQLKSTCPQMICQKEIAMMLDAIDESTELNINEKILEFMNKFDEGVAEMFGINKGDLKSFWVFQMKKEEYLEHFGDEHKGLYENEHKSYLMIVDLDEQSIPTDEEKRIIQWALRQPNPQFWDDRIMRNFKGKTREFVFVRNYGDFRLGYAILFKEHGIITEQKLEQFQSASSYLMLLGKIENLTDKMIKYILEKVV